MRGVTAEITAATIVAASESSNSVSIGERPTPRHFGRRSFRVQIVGCLIAVTLSASAGCGESEPVADYPTAAELERELAYVHYTAVFASACRDADLGNEPGGKYLARIRKRAREIIQTAERHPSDKLDDGKRPSDQLHAMAGFVSCVPDVSKQLEIAARDAEVSQDR